MSGDVGEQGDTTSNMTNKLDRSKKGPVQKYGKFYKKQVQSSLAADKSMESYFGKRW